MRHNFSINFYLKHSTPRKSGKYPIMLRITINKEVADVSLKTLILPEYWDKQTNHEDCSGCTRYQYIFG